METSDAMAMVGVKIESGVGLGAVANAEPGIKEEVAEEEGPVGPFAGFGISGLPSGDGCGGFGGGDMCVDFSDGNVGGSNVGGGVGGGDGTCENAVDACPVRGEEGLASGASVKMETEEM